MMRAIHRHEDGGSLAAPQERGSRFGSSRLHIRAALMAGAVLLPAAGTAHAQAATAPAGSSDAAAEQGGIQDIVVTARRVEENLQKVPLAVTAVTAETMKRANINDYFSLLQQTPGLQNLSRNTGNAAVQGLARIRGVNPVAVFFADAPYPNRQFTLYAPFFDVGSVQILKGPQGTLFGQASNAGVQLIMPRKPGEKFGGYVRAEAGNYRYKSIEGAVDIPVIADKLFVRVAAITRYRRGYIYDSYDGSSIENTDFDAQRISVVFKPNDWIENYTMFQTEKVRDTGAGSVGTIGDYNFTGDANSTLNATLARANGFVLPNGQGDVATFNKVRTQILLQQRALGPYAKQGWSIGCPNTSIANATTSVPPGSVASAYVNGVFDYNRVVPGPCHHGGGYYRAFAFANTTNVNLGENFSIKNIVSHVWGSFRFGLYDNDSTKLIGNDSNPKDFLGLKKMPMTWSEELQFHGKVGPLQFVAGLFGSQEETKPAWPDFSVFQQNLNQAATVSETKVSNRSVYGQVNYDAAALLPGLTMTAGFRHDWDYAYRKVDTLNATTLAYVSTSGGKGAANGEGRWQANSYTLSAQYQITPRTMVYINNSKGHSAGGLQSVVGSERFDPDSLNNVEVGLKSTFSLGDLQLRTNLAGYYGWYNDVKVRTLRVQQVPGTNATQFITATQNAAAARIKGFEAEFTAAFRDLFDLRAFGAYSDAYYTRYMSGDPGRFVTTLVDLKDTPFLMTPKWKVGISPTFHVPMDRTRLGQINIGADYTWRSSYWGNIAKAPHPTIPSDPSTGAICMLERTVANGYPAELADGRMAYKDCAPSLYNLNVSITWDDVMGKEGLRAGLYVTNITQNSNPAGINSQYDTLNAVGWQPNDPRYVFASLQYSF